MTQPGSEASRAESTALALAGALWGARRSGHLKVPGAGGVIELHRGELVDPAAMSALATALHIGMLDFAEADVAARGPTLDPAGLLLEAARRIADEDSIRGHLEWLPLAAPGLDDPLDRLPVAPATRALFDAQTTPPCSLQVLLTRAGQPLDAVAAELAALQALGVLVLVPADEDFDGPDRRRRARTDSVAFRHQAVLDHLTRELERQASGDDHSVLGVPRDADERLLARACNRAPARYRAILADDGQPDAVRTAARQVLERVEAAAQRLRPGLSTDDALTRGRAALQAERFQDARRIFREAREADKSSCDALAGLGWATFRDPRLDETTRRHAGTRLLSKAVAQHPTRLRPRLWLAKALVRLNRPDEAREHVEFVLAAKPDHREALKLAGRL